MRTVREVITGAAIPTDQFSPALQRKLPPAPAA
jgi:hypothetical protein